MLFGKLCQIQDTKCHRSCWDHKALHVFSGINLKSHTEKGFMNGKGQQNTDLKVNQKHSRQYHCNFHRQQRFNPLFLFNIFILNTVSCISSTFKDRTILNIVYCPRLGKDDMQVLKIAFFIRKNQTSMSNTPNITQHMLLLI